ncbi:MAG: hypothetical protein KJ871_16125 [Alphaproteobacteria bacterium]|nr:hypothetical protein [Alphaproteobacteria bacterium]
MPFAGFFGPLAYRTVLRAHDDAAAASPMPLDDDDLTCLDATITDINIKGSDPTLQVRAPDGMNWTVELGSHARNRALGLEGLALLPGDAVRVTGRPTHYLGETRIKALHLTIGQQSFDLDDNTDKAA